MIQFYKNSSPKVTALQKISSGRIQTFNRRTSLQHYSLIYLLGNYSLIHQEKEACYLGNFSLEIFYRLALSTNLTFDRFLYCTFTLNVRRSLNCSFSFHFVRKLFFFISLQFINGSIEEYILIPYFFTMRSIKKIKIL